MKYILVGTTVLLTAFALPALCSDAATKEFSGWETNPQIERLPAEKPVKIKLKRLDNGAYSWEIDGDDVEKIIKADKALRKLLK